MTLSHAGIFKIHQQNKTNAKTVPTTFWTQIWEPEMNFDDDFNHVAQTLQIQMFQLILAFPWHTKTVKYLILLMKTNHGWTVNDSSFWILQTTSSSSQTFHLKSPSESNSCLTHIKMLKKREQFKANVNADVSPAKRPQHAQNQFSRNICKTNRKSTGMIKFDTFTRRNL